MCDETGRKWMIIYLYTSGRVWLNLFLRTHSRFKMFLHFLFIPQPLTSSLKKKKKKRWFNSKSTANSLNISMWNSQHGHSYILVNCFSLLLSLNSSKEMTSILCYSVLSPPNCSYQMIMSIWTDASVKMWLQKRLIFFVCLEITMNCLSLQNVHWNVKNKNKNK